MDTNIKEHNTSVGDPVFLGHPDPDWTLRILSPQIDPSKSENVNLFSRYVILSKGITKQFPDPIFQNRIRGPGYRFEKNGT